MRAAIYIRVSTTEQNYENQKPAIEKYAERRGFEIVAEYAEEASAWRNGHQKELSRLLKDAGAGEFDVLLVWALDRLSREGALKILVLIKRLKDLGVKVISLSESWTEAPSEVEDILYALMGWVAQSESRRISERTKAGIARKKAGGGLVGRKPGAKDKRKRKTEGYRLRQARDRLARAGENNIENLNKSTKTNPVE